jgi:hypothetical protein
MNRTQQVGSKRLLACLLMALFALPGCGKESAEQLSEEMMTMSEELVAVLKTVKDVDSAKAAEPRLAALAAKKKAFDTKAKDLKYSQAELDAAAKKYDERLKQFAQNVMAENMRIAQEAPDAMPIIAKALGNMQ